MFTSRFRDKSLQGAWSGQEVRGNTPGWSSLLVEGTKMEFHGANTQEWYKATFSIREDAAPKQIEAVITECPYPQYLGKTVHGIYRIENGKFTFAANEPGSPGVPASFDAQGARKFILTQK
jgi:uncharacterized protein (TIGR03067 family)